VLLVFGAPSQLPSLAGPEHGRTIPLAETLAALAELEAGKGKRFETVAELMADLRADDDEIKPPRSR